MKAFNWYYLSGRHTRSDRALPKEGTIRVNLDGFELISEEHHKSMKVYLTDEEIDKFIENMQRMKAYKKSDVYKELDFKLR